MNSFTHLISMQHSPSFLTSSSLDIHGTKSSQHIPLLVFHDKQAWERWSYPVLLTQSWQTQAPGKMARSFTLARILYLQTVRRLDKFASCAVWYEQDTPAGIFKGNSEVCETQYRFGPQNVQRLQSHKMESKSLSNSFPTSLMALW